MRYVAAVLAVLAVFAGMCAVAPARVSRSDVVNIHLVNVAGVRRSYFRAVKADVEQAYRYSSRSIQFNTKGHEVYLETIGQRIQDRTYINGAAWCFRSDKGASPDAMATTDLVEAHDAATVAVAVTEILNGPCSSY